MNRTLFSMLAKCIDEDQTNWSVKLPYVLMAYRSSGHESTGLTPHYLVFGHEVSLPLDPMYHPVLRPRHQLMSTIGSRRKKKLSARLISLFDAMLLLSNAVATICTTNVYMAPHTKKADTFSFTTSLFNLEKVQNFPVLGEAPTKFWNVQTTSTIKSKNLLPAKSKLYIVIAWNDIMVKYQLHLMSRPDELPPYWLPHTSSPQFRPLTVWSNFYTLSFCTTNDVT